MAPQERHTPADQHRTLSQKLRGHFAYYGITGNAEALTFRRAIGLWRKWLGRRHSDGQIPWERMYRLLERYPLPAPVVVHEPSANVANRWPDEPDA